MPRIEHVALWTHDLAGDGYRNAAKDFDSCFLDFDGGARLEIMRSGWLDLADAAAGAQRRGLTHLAICVGSEDEVNALTKRLAEDGYQVLDGPRRTGDGCYESVVHDPDGNRVEVTS